MYSFKNFRTINSSGRDIYNGKIILKEVDEDQSSLFVETIGIKKKNKTAKSREKIREKRSFQKLMYTF